MEVVNGKWYLSVNAEGRGFQRDSKESVRVRALICRISVVQCREEEVVRVPFRKFGIGVEEEDGMVTIQGVKGFDKIRGGSMVILLGNKRMPYHNFVLVRELIIAEKFPCKGLDTGVGIENDSDERWTVF